VGLLISAGGLRRGKRVSHYIGPRGTIVRPLAQNMRNPQRGGWGGVLLYKLQQAERIKEGHQSSKTVTMGYPSMGKR